MRPSSESVTARIGQVLGGKYRLKRVLGEGGFGAVYEAEGPNGLAAVKVLHAHLSGEKEIITRFRREAGAADQIGHPHIIDVFEHGEEDNGVAWMAMELLEGRDLTAVLREEGPLPVSRAVEIVSQICDGLGAAHAVGIVHRDLKPDNVFLVPREGREFVKLLDFGVSKFLEAVDGASLMTRTGTTIGTPFYMSPEQAQGKKGIEQRADIYALGVILFELLTAQHPFSDESYPMLVLKICTEPPPPVTRYRGDVPVALQAVIERMLAKTPEARFATCLQVKEALAPFLSHDTAPKLLQAPPTSSTRASALGASMHSAPTALSVDPITGQPLVPSLEEEAQNAEAAVMGGGGKWIAAGAAVLAAAGVAAYFLTQDPEEPDPEPPPAASLPEPGNPVAQPLRAPESNELTWRWMNPLPKAMPTWIDVDVGGVGLVALCGRGGKAAKLVGTNLQWWPTTTEADLNAIAWIGPVQAMAVGDGGAVQVLLATGPRALDVGTEVDLRDVVARGTTDALLVGDEGTVISLRALQPHPVSTGRSEHLFGAHVAGEVAWAVGQRGVVLRVEGDEVSVEREPRGGNLRAVGGCPERDLYAVGDGGTVMRRVDDRWQTVADTPNENWTDVACDGEGRAVVSGSRGGVLLLAGSRFVRLDSGSDNALRGAGSADPGGTWVAGDNGRLAQVDGGHLRLLTAGHTGAVFDVDALGGALVAVGQYGALLRHRDRRFVTDASGTDAALAALAQLRDDALVAVGDVGTVVEITWDSARVLETPEDPRPGWRDVVAGNGELLAVGTEGRLLRGAPGAFTITQVDDVGALWAVAGTPDDAIVVGEDAVLRVDGASVSRVGCEGSWRGVTRGEEGTWLVGEGGRVARLSEDGACSTEHEDGETLHAIGPGPNGRLLAVGEDGYAIERGEDGAWADFEIPSGDFDLRGIYRTDRDVYVVGVGGVILRHPRLDG